MFDEIPISTIKLPEGRFQTFHDISLSEELRQLLNNNSPLFNFISQIVGTNCAPLITDLFLFCYERDFMSNLHKSKQYDLIDMFNDTSRYLDDIFTIGYPEFEKHISDIFIQRNFS